MIPVINPKHSCQEVVKNTFLFNHKHKELQGSRKTALELLRVKTDDCANKVQIFSHPRLWRSSPLRSQPTSRSCTVAPSAPCSRRCLLSVPSTPRTRGSSEASTLTCGSTTGAPPSTWTRRCRSSGPASWSSSSKPRLPQT